MTNEHASTIQSRLESVRSWHKIRAKRSSFRRWLRTKEGLSEMRSAVERAEPRNQLDFRGPDYVWVDGKLTTAPWQRWEPGLPWNIGSGRAAAWHHLSYEQYALICRLVHQHLGWSGELVRQTARALAACVDGGRHEWQPPARPVPVVELVRVAQLPPSYPEHDVWLGQEDGGELANRRNQWRLWIERVVHPAWGEYVLRADLARFAREPNYRTPSNVVGEIRRLRGADTTDFRGCSGCQYLARVTHLTREEQDYLLSRAGAPQRVKLANGALEGIYVPFGLEAESEYDHCLVLGLNYEIRVRSQDYKRLRPEQITAAITGR